LTFIKKISHHSFIVMIAQFREYWRDKPCIPLVNTEILSIEIFFQIVDFLVERNSPINH